MVIFCLWLFMVILCNFRSSQEKTAKGLEFLLSTYLPIQGRGWIEELRKKNHGELWWLNNLDSPWEIKIQPMKSHGIQPGPLGHWWSKTVHLIIFVAFKAKHRDKNCFCCHWLGTVYCTVLELKPVSHWLLCWPHSHHSCLSSPLYGWSTNTFNGSSLILLWSNHHIFGGKTRHLR